MNVIVQFLKWLISLLSSKKVEAVTTTVAPFVSDNTAIDPPDRVAENQVTNPDIDVLKVTYREKYGEEKTIYCMVLFRNDKTRQYKADAPWLKDIVIQMENITGKEVTEVAKSTCLQFIMTKGK